MNNIQFHYCIWSIALFHYLIMLNNFQGLKLTKFPVFIENSDGLNGFHLAAKENNIQILSYLIETYPDYIYNRNHSRDAFTLYLAFEEFTGLINKFPKINIIDGRYKQNRNND